MAGSRRAQLDQWRPEELSATRDRDKISDRPPKGERRPSRERGRSPASLSTPRPRAPDRPSSIDHHHSSKKSSERTHQHHRNSGKHRRYSRSVSRSRTRRSPSPRDLREDLYRPTSKPKIEASERSSQNHRHRHSSPPSGKRRRSRTPSLVGEPPSRSKRRRSRSLERSSSRRPGSSRKPLERPRRRSRSPPVENNYRPRYNQRSISPDKRSPLRRAASPSHPHSRRRHDRGHSPPLEGRARKPKDIEVSDTRRGKDSTTRVSKRSPSPPRSRRSPSPSHHRSSHRPDREKDALSSRVESITLGTRRGRSSSPPAFKGRNDKSFEASKPNRERSRPRKGSLQHASRHEADRKSEDSEKMNQYQYGPPHGRPSRPPIDTRNYSNSPPYMTPHQISPQGQSPYTANHNNWGHNQQQYGSHHSSPTNAYPAHESPYHQNYPPSGPPQSGYYQNQQQYGGQSQQGYQNQPPSYRGSHGGYRATHYTGPDRRYPPSNQNYSPVQAPRGRGGHFSNLSWTPATGSRGGRAPIDKHRSIMAQTGQITLTKPSEPTDQGNDQPEDEEDNPFRPSKDLRVEDETTENEKSKMPPPTKPPTSTSQQGAPTISFALKSKTAPAVNTAPKVDLSQTQKPRLDTQVSAKPKPSARPPASNLSSRPPPESRSDRRYDDRRYESQYDRYDRPDRRRDDRDDRPPRRWEDRSDKGRDYRYSEPRPNRRTEPIEIRERKPEPPRKEKVIRKRLKPRPTLPEEYAASDSVYYRKPGNESVVGSGTYGKVFKAIHVYTGNMVALKKIRMEGERDGFPVTAIREVKLLQSLRHDNIVHIQEVMVEKNDCFMVFEYLSHDLTGLLNHPTYKLDHAQKKDLAKQLFEGLEYLHRKSVLHRDIKAANILVSNKGQLKLADFGLARFYVKRGKLDYTNRVITIWYRSPELLLGETQYGPAVDIWSAACVLVEIFTKHAIFPGDGGEINQLDKIYNVLGTPTRHEWPGIVDMQWFELLRPTERKTSTFADKYRERVTPAAFDLLQAMFLFDPAQRPSAGDVLEHPYFTTEEPAPRRAIELSELEGDWHEFESKALRKERERADKEARKVQRERDAAHAESKRRAEADLNAERETKRIKAEE